MRVKRVVSTVIAGAAIFLATTSTASASIATIGQNKSSVVWSHPDAAAQLAGGWDEPE